MYVGVANPVAEPLRGAKMDVSVPLRQATAHQWLVLSHLNYVCDDATLENIRSMSNTQQGS